MLPFHCAQEQQAVPKNSRKRPTWHPSVRTDFIRLGSVTTNRKNRLTGEQLAVGTDSWSVSTRPNRMFSVLTEGCHVGYSREFVGTVLLYLRTVEYDQCFTHEILPAIQSQRKLRLPVIPLVAIISGFTLSKDINHAIATTSHNQYMALKMNYTNDTTPTHHTVQLFPARNEGLNNSCIINTCQRKVRTLAFLTGNMGYVYITNNKNILITCLCLHPLNEMDIFRYPLTPRSQCARKYQNTILPNWQEICSLDERDGNIITTSEA